MVQIYNISVTEGAQTRGAVDQVIEEHFATCHSPIIPLKYVSQERTTVIARPAFWRASVNGANTLPEVPTGEYESFCNSGNSSVSLRG